MDFDLGPSPIKFHPLIQICSSQAWGYALYKKLQNCLQSYWSYKQHGGEHTKSVLPFLFNQEKGKGFEVWILSLYENPKLMKTHTGFGISEKGHESKALLFTTDLLSPKVHVKQVGNSVSLQYNE